MELAHPLTQIRTNICVIVVGFSTVSDRKTVWTPAAEEFLGKLHKTGLSLTIIGPRPQRKFGSKTSVRYLDRHEVVGLKELASSKAQNIEIRALSFKSMSWVRIRTDVCVTIGPDGVWPQIFEGWIQAGVLSLFALHRWMEEEKWIPGRDFLFVGSSNAVFRSACLLLDRGVRNCFVLEESQEMKGWRSYQDRFQAKGGRILFEHKVLKFVRNAEKSEAYLVNASGTLILPVDTVVLSTINEEHLNAPEFWKRGLFYLQKRGLGVELLDEETWFEKVDYKELYWRVMKQLKLDEKSKIDGALKAIRLEKRDLLSYRKPENRWQIKYSGKILDRDSINKIIRSDSVPKSFAHPKPKASLECFENIPCRACADICPESAIEITKITDQPKLLESKCTGCGACVSICPTGSALMIKELPDNQRARYFLPDDTKQMWKEGRQIFLLNRRGEQLGTGKVVSSTSYQNGIHRLLEIESTNVYLWEARNFGIQPNLKAHTGEVMEQSPLSLKRDWIHFNGVRRLAPVDVLVTTALWQLGLRRFEDALFCRDSSCRLCEVKVDGKTVLACQTRVKAECTIEVEESKLSTELVREKDMLCPCKRVSQKELSAGLLEGCSLELISEMKKLGRGSCHGKWCLSLCDYLGKESRPRFPGFDRSPWRDFVEADFVKERE